MDQFSPGVQGGFPAKVVSKLRTDGNQELSGGGHFQQWGQHVQRPCGLGKNSGFKKLNNSAESEGSHGVYQGCWGKQWSWGLISVMKTQRWLTT